MKAEVYMRQLARKKHHLDVLICEREEILERGRLSKSNLTGTPSSKSGHSDRVGDAAVLLTAYEKKIQKVCDEYWAIHDDLTKTLEMLSYKEAYVLRALYISGWAASKVGDHCTPHPLTERHIYRIKKQALDHLQQILDSRTELNKYLPVSDEQESQKEDSV